MMDIKEKQPQVQEIGVIMVKAKSCRRVESTDTTGNKIKQELHFCDFSSMLMKTYWE